MPADLEYCIVKHTDMAAMRAADWDRVQLHHGKPALWQQATACVPCRLKHAMRGRGQMYVSVEALACNNNHHALCSQLAGPAQSCLGHRMTRTWSAMSMEWQQTCLTSSRSSWMVRHIMCQCWTHCDHLASSEAANELILTSAFSYGGTPASFLASLQSTQLRLAGLRSPIAQILVHHVWT